MSGGAVSCHKAAVWSAVGGREWLAVPVYGVEQLQGLAVSPVQC